MKIQTLIPVFLGPVVLASFAFARSGTPAQPQPNKETALTQHARGTFDVKLTPQPGDDKEQPALSRFYLEKQFHGDLEGTSKGEMLSTGSAQGSGGYVAMERVTGTLNGRSGSFALQHSGVMNRGVPNLTITVVPGSGTGQLSGLSGSFTLTMKDGKHFYDLEYTLNQPK